MTIYVDSDGVIYKPGMKPIGFFDTNGDVYDEDNIRQNGYPVGVSCGYVDKAGRVFKGSSHHLGTVDGNGKVLSTGMMKKGKVQSDGKVYDATREHIATINLSLHEKVHKKDWLPMPFRVAGALILLLNISEF